MCPSVAFLNRPYHAAGSAEVKQHLHVGLPHETTGIETIIGERGDKGHLQLAFRTGNRVSGVLLHQVRLAAQLMSRTAQVRMPFFHLLLIELACVQPSDQALRLCRELDQSRRRTRKPDRVVGIWKVHFHPARPESEDLYSIRLEDAIEEGLLSEVAAPAVEKAKPTVDSSKVHPGVTCANREIQQQRSIAVGAPGAVDLMGTAEVVALITSIRR